MPKISISQCGKTQPQMPHGTVKQKRKRTENAGPYLL
nr:MAG TPA: hypothetical protein [Caudoviricetes sp.]